MRRFIRNTELIFVFAILFIGCKSPIQKQAEYLLPSYNRLELTNTKETGITTYNNYKIEGKLNLNELSDFPINVISEKEKAVIKWHKPTNEELKDFKAFVEEEQSGDKIATELLQKLSEDKYLMSVIYYRDESPIGGKGYQVYNWTEFYFLDFSKNELIHISYGKF